MMHPNLCGRLINRFINWKQNCNQKLNIKANLIEQKTFFQSLTNLGIVANHIKLTTTTLLEKTKLYIDCSRMIFPRLFSLCSIIQSRLSSFILRLAPVSESLIIVQFQNLNKRVFIRRLRYYFFKVNSLEF